MIKINDLKIDVNCFGGEFLLVDIVPYYKYQDGKRIDILEGYRYDVALPKLKMEKLNVKIPNSAPIVDIVNGEEIPMKNVMFEGLEVGCYMSDRNINLTATAKRVSFVK